MSMDFRIQVHTAVADIGREAWDACASSSGDPFLSFAFLDACEASGSAVPQQGWAGRHLSLADETGRIDKDAPNAVALAYPSPYAAGMSSLGYQRIYRSVQELDGFVGHRAFLADGCAAAADGCGAATRAGGLNDAANALRA